MIQLQIDFQPPRARRTDPKSSHKAASTHERSGRLENDKRRVYLALLTAGKPMTSKQIAEQYGIDRHTVARRLPDLERDGKVYRVNAGESRQVEWEVL